MENMKLDMKALLKKLTGLDGAPGAEQEIASFIKAALCDLADEISIDPMGNIVATKNGSAKSPSVMLSAHMDEIACIVKSIEPSGFIRFDKTGDIDENKLPGRRVKLGKVFGVIGIRPKHLDYKTDNSTANQSSELFIDIGASSAREVAEHEIQIGTPICFEGEFRETINPDIVCAKSIDDRAGCAALLTLLQELKFKEFEGTLHVAFTVQEEIGFRGAKVLANRLKPDIAIVIDTIPSGDTPDVSYTKELPVRLGGGPVLVVAESEGFVGHIMGHKMRNEVIRIAEKKCIPLQIAALQGAYVTDASEIHLANNGIPSAVIAIPRRYSHSPIEMTNLQDSVNTVLLLNTFLEEVQIINQNVSSFL